MRMNTHQDLYKTSSLSLAAAIQTVSTAKLEFVEFSALDNKAVFAFDRKKDPSFDDILSRFWARQLPFDLATYFDHLRAIKSRLHEALNIQQ